MDQPAVVAQDSDRSATVNAVSKPCKHATAAVPICDVCEKKRAQVARNRTYMKREHGAPYGVAPLSWSAPLGKGTV